MAWIPDAFSILIGVVFGIPAIALIGWWSRRIRMRKYCTGLNNALCEAIGHYHGTVESIVECGIAGEQAREALGRRPTLDPPNVDEFNPTITVTLSESGNLEDIDVVIEGPKVLIDYISTVYYRSTPVVITENRTQHIDDDVWEVRLSLSVFDNLDAVLIENLRDLITQD